MFNPNNDRTNKVGRETNITVAKQNHFCSFELIIFLSLLQQNSLANLQKKSMIIEMKTCTCIERNKTEKK